MTAHIAPDPNSSTRQGSENPDQQGYSYDSGNTSEYETDYVPEREFVLMPLFRRIGEMLGLRKNQEQEYIYVPEPETSRRGLIVEDKPESGSTAPVQSMPTEVTQEIEAAPMAANAETRHAASPGNVPTIDEEVLEIEQPATLQPEPANHVWVSQDEAADLSPAQFQPQPEPVASVASLPEPVLQQSEAPKFIAEPTLATAEPVAIEQSISSPAEPITARVETPQTAGAPITQQQANDLAAQLREAANKISSAVSQAAEWLRVKEEEILQRAQTTSGPENQALGESGAFQAQPTPAAPIEGRTQVPQWEDREAPALQRELAWREASREAGRASKPAKAEQRSKRLQLVSKPAIPPFWRRIDWAQQFAPKRVAIIGALVMAILMVVGISLARRPAASVLPQQTRTIEPGGVTLTTHSAAAAATSSPAQSQRRVAEPHPSAANPRHQAHLRTQSDDGPDVVTHYYSKSKPSPIHQSTVAGVHHYSDMQ